MVRPWGSILRNISLDVQSLEVPWYSLLMPYGQNCESSSINLPMELFLMFWVFISSSWRALESFLRPPSCFMICSNTQRLPFTVSSDHPTRLRRPSGCNGTWLDMVFGRIRLANAFELFLGICLSPIWVRLNRILVI